jgi:hypothetical protein
MAKWKQEMKWLASIESVSIINGEMAAENNEKQSMAK